MLYMILSVFIDLSNLFILSYYVGICCMMLYETRVFYYSYVGICCMMLYETRVFYFSYVTTWGFVA